MIKGKETKLDGGPQHFSRHYIEPEDGLCQTLHIHLEEYAPGGTTQKHRPVSMKAAFYILDGAGYEIHDGVRYDWKAGDVAIVHNNCVHQHTNASARELQRAPWSSRRSRCICSRNMLFQHTVIKRPKTHVADARQLRPRDDEEGLQPPLKDKIEEEV